MIASFVFSGFHWLVIRFISAITIKINTKNIQTYLKISRNAHPFPHPLGKKSFSIFPFMVFFHDTQEIL